MLPPLGLIIQDSYYYLIWLFLILCVFGLLYIVYYQFIKTYFELKSSDDDSPPETGKKYLFVTNESDRLPTFAIGRNVGNIITKCTNILEDHLIFQFKKDPVAEDYDIIIKRSGPVLYKPPRMPHYALMSSTEKLESHEVIGKTAEFRISNKTVKERMTNYIEISLTSSFIINKMGKERLQFIFTINKIQPGFNFAAQNADGNVPFGKEDNLATSTVESI
jgi:hypothetical protein